MPDPASEMSGMDRGLTWQSVLAFFLLTFMIAWGIMGVFVLFPDWLVAHFGEVSGHNPLFILAVYAPAISALTLVLVHSGGKGVLQYLARFTLWRGPWVCWAVLLAGIPLVYFAGAALKGTAGAYRFPFPAAGPALGAVLAAGLVGPVEEIGWRGFALPVLQRSLPPLAAALIVGAAWGLWHLPAFHLSGTPQSAWAFTPFLAGSVSTSVILTALFNTTRGSMLWAALFHWQLNNPIWPDAQPWDMWLFTALAIVVTALNWRDLTSSRKAVRSIYVRP